MTERAIFIEDNASNAQSGPYSMGVMDNMVRAMMGWPSDDAGVIGGADNELAASIVGGAVRIASGYAHIHGMVYWNDSNVDLTPTTPAVGTTRKRIVLRKEWDDPVAGSITVKLAVVEGTDGLATLPALTQTDGTRWEIPIAYFDVNTSGIISGLTSDDVPILGPGTVAQGSVDSSGTVSGIGIMSGAATTNGVSVTLTGTASRVTPVAQGYFNDGGVVARVAYVSAVSGTGTTTLTFTIAGVNTGTIGGGGGSATYVEASDTGEFVVYFTAYR